MKKIWSKLACFFTGHPVVPTGRHGTVLVEHKCLRCGGVYISHPDHGDQLLPWNPEFEEIVSGRYFRDE